MKNIMKNKFFAPLATGLLVLTLSPAAHASDGTIFIMGRIKANTCTIDADNDDPRNGPGRTLVVRLPEVSTAAFSGAGTVAGSTPFQIVLSACTPNTGKVRTYFEANHITSSDGLLSLMPVVGRDIPAATNVKIQLLNSDFSAIQVGLPDGSQNSKFVDIAAGNATLRYYAQYRATAAGVTAGDALSIVTYSMVYQ